MVKNSHINYIIKVFIPICVGFFIYLIPIGEGIDPRGWKLLAIFIATISGIILKPLPMPAVALIGMASCVISNSLDIGKEALEGFSNPVVWLVVFIFFIARVFIKTDLGRRIAYLFIALLGKRSLSLSYGIACTELLTGAAIPSNTARAGAIIYPAVQSISEALGSSPENGSQRKIGSFLTLVAFQSNVIVSAIFLTAMAANPMIQAIALEQGIIISWGDWFTAAIVPGLFSLILVPLLLYYIYPPQLKQLPEAVTVAKKKLQEIGPMRTEEWIIISLFVGMITLWIFEKELKIPATAVALLGLSILLLTRILTWEDLAKEQEAWSTLIWLAILIALSRYLEQLGIVGWFSQKMALLFEGSNPLTCMYSLGIIYFYSHYFFASNSAHVGAMYSTFLTVAIATGAPPAATALLLGFFSSLFSSITHYATGPAPLYFAKGYLSIREWWLYGFIVSIVNIAIWIGIGSIWWRFLGII